MGMERTHLHLKSVSEAQLHKPRRCSKNAARHQPPTSPHVFASVRLLTRKSLGTPHYGAPCKKNTLQTMKMNFSDQLGLCLVIKWSRYHLQGFKVLSFISTSLRPTVLRPWVLRGHLNPTDRFKQVFLCKRSGTLLLFQKVQEFA